MTEARLVVCGLVASTQMSFGGIVPALPSYGEWLGVGAAQLGIIVAAFGLGRLCINLPAGLLLRRIPALPFLFVSVLGVFFITTATAFISEYHLVLTMRVLAGVFCGAAITAGQSVLVSSSGPGERGRVMTVLQAFQMSGAAAGPALGGFAASLWGPLAAFFASVAGTVVFLIWAVLRRRRVRRDLGRAAEGAAASARPLTYPVTHSARIFFAVALINVTGFAIFAIRFGGQQSVIPLVGTELAHLEPWHTGVGMAGVTVLSLILLPVVARMVDTYDRRWVLVPALAMAAVMTPLFLVADTPWLFLIVLAVTGALNSIGNGVPLAQLADIVSPGKISVVMGVYRTSGDLGTILGAALLAFVLDDAGPTTAIFTISALGIVGAVAACVPTPRKPQHPKPTPSPDAAIERTC